MFDVVTFGSATVDIFVESNSGNIIDIRGIDGEKSLYALEYGGKIEIDHSSFDVGGGAINTATCFSRLGLNTASVVKIGNGVNSQTVLEKLEKENISQDFVIKSIEDRTGFSIILTSFEGDRTVLAHRGANITIKESDIDFDKLKNTKWIYCAPLNSKFENIMEKIANFAKENNIKLAHNLGGKLLDSTINEIAPMLRNINILTLNTSEATRITGIVQKFSKDKRCVINCEVVEMLKVLKSHIKDVVIITDGDKGAYAYDGKDFYYSPIFPTMRKSSLGAGDAFASTFCACYMKGYDIKTSLEIASINSGSVVKFFNAQDGLLSFDELLKAKNEHKNYQASIVDLENVHY